MRASEIRELNDTELLTKFLDLKEELFNLRFQSATGSLEKHNLIPAVRKDIARVETILNERGQTADNSSERTSAASDETKGSTRPDGREAENADEVAAVASKSSKKAK